MESGWPTSTGAAGDTIWDFDPNAAPSDPNVDLFDGLGVAEMMESLGSPEVVISTPNVITSGSENGSGMKRKVSQVSHSDGVDGKDDACFEQLNLDGLGALRPSTSFNDFAHLLLPDCVTSDETVANSNIVTNNIQQKKGSNAKETNRSKASKGDTKRSVKQKVGNGALKKGSLVQNNKGGPAILPRFNGIGKKTSTATAATTTGNKSSTKAVPVSVQSSPCASSNCVVELVGNKTSSDLQKTRDHAVTAKAAVTAAAAAMSESAVATAAAAAANLLKQSAMDGKNAIHPGAAAGATGYSFKNNASALVNAATKSAANVNATKSNTSPPDTSTDHIHALTSSNWVAACNASGVANFSVGTDSNATGNSSSGTTGGPATAALTAQQQASAAAAAQAAANKRRRQNLTADERAKQNRDRNREHARNTRLRKKAYVEELKRTLTELVHQRDAAEVERKRSVQREAEQREVRYRVLEEFLKLRGNGNKVKELEGKWRAILEDGFELILPVTSYREMVHTLHQTQHNANNLNKPNIVRQVSTTPLLGDESDDTIAAAERANLNMLDAASSNSNSHSESAEQILHGVQDTMKDATLLSNLLEVMANSDGANTISNNNSNLKQKIFLSYRCDKSRMMMDGTHVVVPWTAQSVGAVSRGAKDELYLKGSARANYNASSNKLKSVELMFDTGAVISQLSAVFPHFADDSNQVQELEQPQQDISSLTVADADALLDSIHVPQIGMLSSGGNNECPLDLHDISASEQSDSSTSADENDQADNEIKHTNSKPRRSARCTA